MKNKIIDSVFEVIKGKIFVNIKIRQIYFFTYILSSMILRMND